MAVIQFEYHSNKLTWSQSFLNVIINNLSTKMSYKKVWICKNKHCIICTLNGLDLILKGFDVFSGFSSRIFVANKGPRKDIFWALYCGPCRETNQFAIQQSNTRIDLQTFVTECKVVISLITNTHTLYFNSSSNLKTKLWMQWQGHSTFKSF